MTTQHSPVGSGVDAAHRRLQDRVGVVVTIAAGTFSAAAVVGLTLLPASTRAQQALILLACLAFGVATYAGVGVWRSAGRFTVTAASMAVVLVCLASLSIATQSAVEETLVNQPATSDSGDVGRPVGQEPGGPTTGSVSPVGCADRGELPRWPALHGHRPRCP